MVKIENRHLSAQGNVLVSMVASMIKPVQPRSIFRYIGRVSRSTSPYSTIKWALPYLGNLSETIGDEFPKTAQKIEELQKVIQEELKI